jgi:hypothetical protein
MNKNEIKDFIQETIQKQIDSSSEELTKKLWRRINTICRTKINRFSFDLKKDGTKIYLVKDGKERIIESKSRVIYLSNYAFKQANELLKKASDKFIEEKNKMS